MIKYTIEDDFDIGVDAYWQLFFDDEDSNRGLYEALKIDRRVEMREDEGKGEGLVIRRRIVMTPQREVPRLFKRVVKGAIQYTEHNVFTRRTNTIEVRIEPSFAADKFTSSGQYRVAALGEDRVRRTFDGEVNCKIPLIGGKVEKHIVDEVRDSYRETTRFTRAWIRDH